MSKPKLGKYRHYKGNEYEVVGFAKHSETMEDLIVYKPLYDFKDFSKDLLWVRPKGMFLEDVEVDGVKKPRFKYIG